MKPSKLIKAMSLLPGMFSFLLAGCGGLPDDSSSAETPVSSVEEHVHVYDTENIEWSWSGYESATATFTCVDNDDSKTIDATVTSEVTAEAACETKGETAYTATVTFEGETYTDQKIRSVDATGHVWDTENIEWTWSDDYSMAIATFTCMNDLNHTQKKTASVSSVTTESTCAEPGETTYTATVEFENNTYTDIQTEYIAPVSDHDIDETSHTCNNCGYKDGLEFTLNADGVSYSVTGDGKYVTYHGNSVEIPAYYNRLPVTAIGSYAFYVCTGITDVSVPFTVITIGEFAFYSCRSLADITLSEGVTGIGERAFAGCQAMTGITLPSTLGSLGRSVFRNCNVLAEIVSENGFVYFDSENKFIYVKNSDTSYSFHESIGSGLSDVTLPDTVNSLAVTGIDDFAFYEFKSLTGIGIPEAVTHIGEGAFSYCTSLTSIDLPEGLTYLGGSAFRECRSLENIDIPKGVSDIGDYTFCRCTSLAGITFASDSELKSVGVRAFSYCSVLKNIILPEGVESIGEYAFGYCTSLESITLPSTLTSLGYDVFYNCSALAQIVSENGFVYFDSENQITYVKNSDTSYCVFGVLDKNLESITIPSAVNSLSVTEIGESVFNWFTYLTKAEIQEGIETVGARAFYYCTSLVSVILPSSVETIGDAAFEDCSSLTYIFYAGSQYTLSYSFYYGTVYCYSEEEPTTDGNYWHYVDGVPTVWETTTATE